MSKPTDSKIEAETTEIIELAINDIDTLARAFDIIAQACQELNDREISLDNDDDHIVIN